MHQRANPFDTVDSQKWAHAFWVYIWFFPRDYFKTTAPLLHNVVLHKWPPNVLLILIHVSNNIKKNIQQLPTYLYYMMSGEHDEERGCDFQCDALLFLFQHLQQITSQSPEDMPRFMPSPQSHPESRICNTFNATSDRMISGMPRPQWPHQQHAYPVLLPWSWTLEPGKSKDRWPRCIILK